MSTEGVRASILSIMSPTSFRMLKHHRNEIDSHKLIPRKPLSFKNPHNTSTIGPYEIGQPIGEGAYSTVYVVRQQCNLYAMKVVWKDDPPKNSKIRVSPITEIQNELKALTLISQSGNSNLINLFDTFNSRTKVYFVTNLARGGALSYAIPSTGITENQARTYIIQLLNAIAGLHEIGIVHRDIKLDNILIDAHGDIFLSDFGLCSITSPTMIENHRLYNRAGSPHYVAPEIIYLAENGYNAAPTDIWSAGVCFFAMLTGTLPFNSSDTQQLYLQIKACRYNFPAYCKASISAKSFLSRMLEPDHNMRATLKDLVRHSFITEYIADIAGPDSALFRVLEDAEAVSCPVTTMAACFENMILEENFDKTPFYKH